LLVVDTAWMKGGLCAEIGCLAAEKGFADLKAPVVRIGLPDVPTPAGFTLEQFYYPDTARIADAMRRLARSSCWPTSSRAQAGDKKRSTPSPASFAAAASRWAS